MAKQGNDWKAYDGRELKGGEVLVPQMVTQEYARSIGADMSALRTWTTAGIRYTVMFVPVPEEQEEICRKIFCQELNEYLDEKIGPARRGRCCTSLDELAEKGYDPADRRASTEAIVMEEILLNALGNIFSEFFAFKFALGRKRGFFLSFLHFIFGIKVD